ncbi:MAG: metallophosphoesterase [Thermoanaerobaculia bacterium]
MPRGRLARLGLVGALLAALDGLWVEPRLVLLREAVRLPAERPVPLRIVHLSDLHVARETAIERRLLRRLAAERPDLILLSGDLVADTKSPSRMAAHTEAAARVLAELAHLAPTYGVQGHSEYLGSVVARFNHTGVTWLSNQGVVLGGSRGFLLLGLNQQVGGDLFTSRIEPPFKPLTVGGSPAFGRDEEGNWNDWASYDPGGAGLADNSGALDWSGYEASCELWLGDRDSEGGLSIHNRYEIGEDRLLSLGRASPDSGVVPRFLLGGRGTAFTNGKLDTGLDPEPRRWYRLRLRSEVSSEQVTLRGKVWPADAPEPADWQVWAEDRSPERVTSGTVALWGRGGSVAYRDLKVTAADGRVLLEAPLTGKEPPSGFRQGTRASRLALALARTAGDTAGLPRVALTHAPDVVLEAAWRGLDAVLAGHTHGGQVRLPRLFPLGGIALTTRSTLGSYFDRGSFDLPSRNPRGWTRLYINAGVGTSLLPIRFCSSPAYAVVELGPGG